LRDVARRLLANVQKDCGDLAPDVVRLPTSAYLDPVQYQREIELIYRTKPMVTALSVDIPKPGDYTAFDMAERSVLTMRGDDGVARSFINACRHRGTPLVCTGTGHERRLTCPYHAWVYDTKGALVGVPHREQFGPIDVTSLIELPTAERAGLVFAVLTPGLPIDIDEWLGDMADALVYMELDKMYPYEVTTDLVSGNWKSTADGYLDGYHIGYLHSANLGLKQINNRNTFDLYGPHVRLGFANKTIVGMKDVPVEDWNLPDVMSVVHFIFPNISLSGQPGRATMMSRMLPGPTFDRSLVVQHQYSRVPLDTPELRDEIEARRILYAAITGDEDFGTVLGINRVLPGMEGQDFLFGRNESGNQNLHNWVAKLTAKG
jgi:nitrite reductase/ring-hydroxylating ferredoxin subunit